MILKPKVQGPNSGIRKSDVSRLVSKVEATEKLSGLRVASAR